MRDISELIYETCKTYLVHAGQIPLVVGAVHRRGDGDLLRLAARALTPSGWRSSWHSAWSASWAATASRGSASASTRMPIRGPRSPAWRQAVSGLRNSAASRHQHRHAADQRRAGDHAGDFAVRAGRLCRAVLHRFCDRRIAGRGGAAHCRRHLHEDRRHRRRPHEDRLQYRRRRCREIRA